MSTEWNPSEAAETTSSPFEFDFQKNDPPVVPLPLDSQTLAEHDNLIQYHADANPEVPLYQIPEDLVYRDPIDNTYRCIRTDSCADARNGRQFSRRSDLENHWMLMHTIEIQQRHEFQEHASDPVPVDVFSPRTQSEPVMQLEYPPDAVFGFKNEKTGLIQYYCRYPNRMKDEYCFNDEEGLQFWYTEEEAKSHYLEEHADAMIATSVHAEPTTPGPSGSG